MKRTHAEQAQIVSEKLGQIPPIIHQVLDESTEAARKFFEKRKLSPDVYLFPHLVRFEAGCRLQLDEFRDAGYEFISLSNNGLMIYYNFEGCYYKIRVRKADEDGELPTQNLSATLKRHYTNQTPFLPSIDGTLETYVATSKLNLVVVWDVDEQFNLTEIYLVCPKNEIGELYFADVIQHAVTAVVGNEEFDEELKDLDDITILPIQKKQKQ